MARVVYLYFKAEIREGQASHEQKLETVQQRFLREKLRMKETAERQLHDLALEARAEAVASLSETTKATFNENARLSASLKIHMSETKSLRREALVREERLANVCSQLEELQATVQHAVSKANREEQRASVAEERVHALEKTLNEQVGLRGVRGVWLIG